MNNHIFHIWQCDRAFTFAIFVYLWIYLSQHAFACVCLSVCAVCMCRRHLIAVMLHIFESIICGHWSHIYTYIQYNVVCLLSGGWCMQWNTYLLRSNGVHRFTCFFFICVMFPHFDVELVSGASFVLKRSHKYSSVEWKYNKKHKKHKKQSKN